MESFISGIPSNSPVPGILSKSLSKDTDKAHAAKPISPLLARSGCTYLPFGKPKKSQNNTLVLVMFCH